MYQQNSNPSERKPLQQIFCSFFNKYLNDEDKRKILLDQKRKEITSLLESKLISMETFRLLNEYIKNLTYGISK